MKKKYNLEMQIYVKIEEKRNYTVPLIIDFENKKVFALSNKSIYVDEMFEAEILEGDNINLHELKDIVIKQYINGESREALKRQHGEIAEDIIDKFKNNI